MLYYIGIDISKFKHDIAAINSDGEVITPSWTFYNTYEGFSSLKEFLAGISGEIRIGFESTGHYGQNLKLFLEANHYTFMEFNPLVLKKFVASKTLRRTKTDSLDAISIAQYLMTVEYKPYPSSFYHIEALKSLTRFRNNLIKQRSRQLVELTNILDLIFPEFKPFFDNKLGATSMYILANYQTPEKIANMNSKSYEILRSKSRGHFTTAKFNKLKLLAKNTVGHSTDYLVMQMEMTIDIYNQMDAKIDQLESEIKAILSDINTPIVSIPGIGEMSVASIIGEYGDFNRFSNPSKMLSFAGIEPGYYQSGTSEHGGRMVKHGSPYLRYTLMNCALTLVQHNIVFAEYYSKKRAEGKTHRVALSHVAKKFVRMIYTMQIKNVTFDYDLAH